MTIGLTLAGAFLLACNQPYHDRSPGGSDAADTVAQCPLVAGALVQGVYIYTGSSERLLGYVYGPCRAGFLGHRQSLLGDVGDRDLRSPLRESHLHREEPDRARPRDKGVVSGPNARLLAGPDANRERLHQRAGVVREVVRQREREVLVDRHVVRKRSVDGRRREEADVRAEVVAARPALAAGHIGDAR